MAAGRQGDHRRGGAIAAASELAVDLDFLENKHQTPSQGHREMEKSVASSPRGLVPPEKEQRWLHTRRGGENRRRDPKQQDKLLGLGFCGAVGKERSAGDA